MAGQVVSAASTNYIQLARDTARQPRVDSSRAAGIARRPRNASSRCIRAAAKFPHRAGWRYRQPHFYSSRAAGSPPCPLWGVSSIVSLRGRARERGGCSANSGCGRGGGRPDVGYVGACECSIDKIRAARARHGPPAPSRLVPRRRPSPLPIQPLSASPRPEIRK